MRDLTHYDPFVYVGFVRGAGLRPVEVPASLSDLFNSSQWLNEEAVKRALYDHGRYDVVDGFSAVRIELASWRRAAQGD